MSFRSRRIPSGTSPQLIATLQSGTLVYLELAGLGPGERQEILALHPGKSRTSFRGGGSGGHGG